MKKLLTTLCVIALFCSPAFGNATSDLFDALEDKDTTVQKVQTLIKFGANVNARQHSMHITGQILKLSNS